MTQDSGLVSGRDSLGPRSGEERPRALLGALGLKEAVMLNLG